MRRILVTVAAIAALLGAAGGTSTDTYHGVQQQVSTYHDY